jgi:hypothetical protein
MNEIRGRVRLSDETRGRVPLSDEIKGRVHFQIKKVKTRNEIYK